ncbi:MAG: CHASE2 domain-containing protein [Alphaproteobacteria bacterium]|nr:CHASE2 domain-containing protein [Alphaproteobacteria bacterium]
MTSPPTDRAHSRPDGFRHKVVALGRLARRRMPLTPLAALIAAALAVLYAAGAMEPLDRFLLEQRLSFGKRQASGSLVIVEIDARSIQALESWPWPRGLHAQAIHRLLDAGAAVIAFDVDFSARSQPEQDAALAAAIARGGERIILPTFAQGASTRAHAVIAESAPNAQLLGARTQLGGVNVITDADGRIWSYAVGLDVAGHYRPSLAVLLADSGRYASQTFHIDYSIREETIPIVSYIDVLTGSVDPKLFADRKVLIGATATELGDIQAVPVYGILPGVVVQALAYETIVQGRTIARASGAVTIVGLFALMPVICLATRRQRVGWQRSLLAAGTIAAALVAVVGVAQSQAALSIDLATWLVALAAWSAAGLIRALQGQSRRLMRRHFVAVQQRRMMRAVVESSFDGIVVADDRDRVAHANPMAAAILGRDPATMIGTPVDALFPAEAVDRRRDTSDGAMREHEIVHHDGRTVHVELVIRALEMAGVPEEAGDAPDRGMMVLTFRDVTERHQAMAALRAALVEAESANRLKSEFLAAMSHELRTPLNAILGFSEIIRDRGLGGALDRYAEYAGEINVAGRRLSSLVEGMLDFALAASGKMRLTLVPTGLAQVLRRAVDRIGAAATAGGLDLVLEEAGDPSPAPLADARRIEEVASHLLSNAVKFTPRGGRVTACILRRDGAAGFEIRDTGIGMTPDEIKTALEPLTQVDGRLQRAHEGAGLGLSLAKKLVELHGGTLAIRSAPGEGTAVLVWLPLAEPARAAA